MAKEMVRVISGGVFVDAHRIISQEEVANSPEYNNISPDVARGGTMAYKVLKAHSTYSSSSSILSLKFDALASHDITYVGIIQTAIASGLKEFPLPYVLTNCHNSLSAVGGTINEDDHVFGLSAAIKFGGQYVPPHLAVIHQYMREMVAGGGKMILGSDSHTRYGALGTLAIGEGGPELVKQLLGKTYDITAPEVVAIYLDNEPAPGIGPQDVALAIEKAVFNTGFVKNKIMEFIGPGIHHLSQDFRNGVDVMTTETACLSSIWETDAITEDFLTNHHRPFDYKEMHPDKVAYYDGLVYVDLSALESMIAMPCHPSNVYTIKEINEGGRDLLDLIEQSALEKLENKSLSLGLRDKYHDGALWVNQGIIVGCSGGLYENVAIAANILDGHSIGNRGFEFSVYPSSQPIYLELMKHGYLEAIMNAGGVVRTAFCGPCFGAGDTPSNQGFSVRHATRNFPNREGSKPMMGQISSVGLMDARSIAATAVNHGKLTPATDIDVDTDVAPYTFSDAPYKSRVYSGFGESEPEAELIYAPSIKQWPTIDALREHILLRVAAYITDPVTTTDELIPSGETSSYRSDPYRLSEFALSRKVPAYVGKAKAIRTMEENRKVGNVPAEIMDVFQTIYEHMPKDFVHGLGDMMSQSITDDETNHIFRESHEYVSSKSFDDLVQHTSLASTIYANKPGDGSAREQAASCQRVLGGGANIALEYATKRYRSNVINWGMIPFTIDRADAAKIKDDDYIFVPHVRSLMASRGDDYHAYIIRGVACLPITLHVGQLTDAERQIIVDGCLINYYKNQH